MLGGWSTKMTIFGGRTRKKWLKVTSHTKTPENALLGTPPPKVPYIYTPFARDFSQGFVGQANMSTC